jgi:hypothetical protein
MARFVGRCDGGALAEPAHALLLLHPEGHARGGHHVRRRFYGRGRQNCPYVAN